MRTPSRMYTDEDEFINLNLKGPVTPLPRTSTTPIPVAFGVSSAVAGSSRANSAVLRSDIGKIPSSVGPTTHKRNSLTADRSNNVLEDQNGQPVEKSGKLEWLIVTSHPRPHKLESLLESIKHFTSKPPIKQDLKGTELRVAYNDVSIIEELLTADGHRLRDGSIISIKKCDTNKFEAVNVPLTSDGPIWLISRWLI